MPARQCESNGRDSSIVTIVLCNDDCRDAATARQSAVYRSENWLDTLEGTDRLCKIVLFELLLKLLLLVLLLQYVDVINNRERLAAAVQDRRRSSRIPVKIKRNG